LAANGTTAFFWDVMVIHSMGFDQGHGISRYSSTKPHSITFQKAVILVINMTSEV